MFNYGYDPNDNRTSAEIPVEEKKRILKESLDVILQEAYNIGFDPAELASESYVAEATFLDEGAEDMLNEAIEFSSRGNVMARSKASWFNWFQSRAAIAYAKAHKDSNYDKLVFHTRKRKEYLDKIKTKYASQAKARAKELMQGSKATSNVFKNQKKTPAKKK